MSDVVSFELHSRAVGTHRVLIDADDLLLVANMRWHVVRPPRSRTLYVKAQPRRGVHLQLHRLLLNAQPGTQVDHVNGNGLDNRRANLRFCTQQQNNYNTGLQRNNRSGLKGVSWHARGEGRQGRWCAQYSHNYRSVLVGYFKTAEEAHAAYLAAVAPLHGDFFNAASSAPDPEASRSSEHTSRVTEG